MSTLHHESILENLYEEEMANMIKSGYAELMTQEALEEHCAFIAKRTVRGHVPMINEFPDITEIEAKHGFSIEALEQLEYIITYLNECARLSWSKRLKSQKMDLSN